MDYDHLELDKETIFKDAVITAAENKSAKIIAEAQQKSQSVVNKAKLECELPGDEEVQAEQGKDGEQQLAAALAQARKSLLFHRGVLVDEIFEDVKQKLLQFAQSGEYEKWLLNKITNCAQNADEKTQNQLPVVLLCKNDMKFKQAAEKAVPGCTVQQDTSILLGGAKLRYNDVLYNETLDEALAEAKEIFYAESKLNV